MATLSEDSGRFPGQYFPNQPNLRFDASVLRLAMPVEAYDCMMDHGTLPQSCCYHADMMEAAMPNGIEHDARAAAIHELFVRASVESGARIRSGTTIPAKSPPGATPERRHPDAHLYLDPAKIERLRFDRSDPCRRRTSWSRSTGRPSRRLLQPSGCTSTPVSGFPKCGHGNVTATMASPGFTSSPTPTTRRRRARRLPISPPC